MLRTPWLGFVVVGLKPVCSRGFRLEENAEAEAEADCKPSHVTGSATLGQWILSGKPLQLLDLIITYTPINNTPSEILI